MAALRSGVVSYERGTPVLQLKEKKLYLCNMRTLIGLNSVVQELQGYLTYKKTHPPSTLPLAYA